MSLNLQYGVVTAWDAKTCRVRVRLHENGLESYWLQIPQGFSQNSPRRCPVEIGTDVALLLKEDGVEGILLGAIFSSANPPPIADNDTDYIRYQDGTTIEYKPSSHELNIALAQSAKLNINAQAGMNIQSTLQIKGDIIVNGISFLEHVHKGVRAGPDSTAKPS